MFVILKKLGALSFYELSELVKPIYELWQKEMAGFT
jgi:hypothetical protein